MCRVTGGFVPRAPRHELYLRICYRDAAEYLSDWTENISAGGLFVRTDRALAVGDEVPLTLSFPTLLEPAELMGEVIWRRPASAERPAGVGLRVRGDVGRRRLAELALMAAAERLSCNHRYRVLVVEDNPHVLESYQRALRELTRRTGGAVEIALAQNGREALAALDEKPAHLLIADVYMPLMDGIRLVTEVRRRAPEGGPAILLVTSATESEVRAELRAPIDGFLHKPIQFGQLLETVVCLLALD
jgi:uncharacterized protein (TIGR02266 family)